MGSKSPKAPDPYAVGQAQTATNVATAQEQAKMGMTGQSTPFGSIQYVTDPSSPSGYRAITTLTPEEQALLQQSQGLTAQSGALSGQQMGIIGDQLGRVSDSLATPFDLDASRGKQISDIQQTFLDPVWDQRQTALETSLQNRGIRPGSDAYNTAMTQFNNQRSSAYDQMFLDSFNTANNAALQNYELPLQVLGMLGNPQPTQTPPTPQQATAQTPSPGVAPTDLTSSVYQTYGLQQSAANQAMGGLYGLGSAALGGWASAGFPGAAAALAALSDPRAKQDVKRIGTDPRGWGVYVFRYIEGVSDDQDWKVGYMADEVERIRPDAVHLHPTGFKMVDYGALADEKARPFGYTLADVSHAKPKTHKKRAFSKPEIDADVNSKTW